MAGTGAYVEFGLTSTAVRLDRLGDGEGLHYFRSVFGLFFCVIKVFDVAHFDYDVINTRSCHLPFAEAVIIPDDLEIGLDCNGNCSIPVI